MPKKGPANFPPAIKQSGFSIYDSLEQHPELFIDTESLEVLLNRGLAGLSLNYPLRTRSKVLKSAVCQVLGYPVPKSFKKTQPRFPGQNFDTYVQKADNLQIWNEEVALSRRYVLVRVDANDRVTSVRVATGELIAELDTTGTLTQKFQAKSRNAVTQAVLVSRRDTDNVIRHLVRPDPTEQEVSALVERPDRRDFVPIEKVFELLRPLLGSVVENPGLDQERNRSAVLHRLICERVWKIPFADSGQFPDVIRQLLELKLQTSPTIDLGLVSPDSTEQLPDFPDFHHCDVRYAVFYGTVISAGIRLDHLVLTTGADFFSFFQRFEGKVRNVKLQIPLPRGFFSAQTTAKRARP